MNNNNSNFALLGLGGFIAPKHVKAILNNNCKLICSMDISDSVGYIDNFFPNSYFFTEFERFDRYIDKISDTSSKIDFLSICSPNYLHDSHIRFGLRSKANVVCEKPLVISPWNLDTIEKIQKEYSKKVFSINQLRLHPSIVKLKKQIQKLGKISDVEITYISARGKWYQYSWKGDENKSGGILYNIGIHFFDLITYLYGDIESSHVYYSSSKAYSGVLRLKNANVRYFLSIDSEHLRHFNKDSKKNTFKSMSVNKKKIDLSENFENLHTLSYRKILENKGYEINSIRAGIELVYKIKNSKARTKKEDYHPLLNKIT